MFWLSALLILLAIAIAYAYNRLVRARNRVNTAWSDIDVQLQRRHDLVPQLVDAVKHYAKYERATLEAVGELREAALRPANMLERSAVEGQLEEGLGRLVALAENYPDLKASDNFLKLQAELVETEDYLQFARRYYNGSVRDYNTLLEVVPVNFVAKSFGFDRRDFFQKTADDVANVPRVSLGTRE
jgi:LemA protein